MTRGLYAAAAGMLASQAAQDAIAQNLANASTTGYKQDIPQFMSFQETLMRRLNGNGSGGAALGTLGQGATLYALATDFADGTLQQTGNPLDVGLSGDAALAVQTPQGVRFSRDGALTRNGQGFLAQSGTGALVLDTNNQPLHVPAKAKSIQIGAQGEITVDGAALGRLRLVGLSRAAGAVKVGDNQFTAASARPASASATVHQGFLEASNVSVVKEMVAMIAVTRAYETDQKMAQAEDEATGHAVSEVGKV